MQFALGKRKKKNDREVARQEGEFGSTALWIMLVHLSFQVSLFLKIKLWSHKQF
jgi:hypothetical protein